MKRQKAIKRAVNKLHSIIRDSDANSNIVTRFDEISKLLFVRLMSGRNIFKGFEQKMHYIVVKYKKNIEDY